MIPFIFFSLTLVVIEVCIAKMHEDQKISPSSNSYIVKIPNMLKYVGIGVFVVGLIMFCTFLAFLLMENPTVTNGHLIFTSIIMVAGLLITMFANNWKIVIHQQELTLYKLFHKAQTFNISNLTYDLGSKKELRIYENNKKITTVDSACDSYQNLLQTLSSNQKKD